MKNGRIKAIKAAGAVCLAALLAAGGLQPVSHGLNYGSSDAVYAAETDGDSGSGETEEKTSGDYKYKVINGNEAEITGYIGSGTEVVIPDTLDGYKVTSIGDYAFYLCGSLITSITISDSVTSIGNWAFYDCDSLADVNISDNVTSIGGSAFSRCCSLTSIKIPSSVTNIGSEAFYGCNSLTCIVADEKNKKYRAEGNCLIEGSTVILGCQTSTIPDEVTSIGADAFGGCNKLVSINIPDSVTSIGSGAFFDCNSLTSIKIPNSVASIGDYAFKYCSGLASIEMSNNVTSIGYSAFDRCSSLTSIEIPEGVASIGDWTFYGCDSLVSIKIPDSVNQIGWDVFVNCSALKKVIVQQGSYAETWFKKNLPSVSIEYANANINKQKGNKSDDKTTENKPQPDVKKNSGAGSSSFTIGTGEKVTAKVLSGKWENSGTGRKFKTQDGKYPTSEWAVIDGKPYYFDRTGNLAANEYADGKWFNADGSQTYAGTLSWAANGTGWWVQDTAGWYPTDSWLKVDGTSYYFDAKGYMAANEYAGGLWFNADGSQTYAGTLSWASNGTGWWVQDTAGWYPTSQWLKINGSWYYFNAAGYMESDGYVDGCWLDGNGVWNPDSASGSWGCDATGWWYGDTAGWYPTSQWLKINGSWYWFDENGYMVTNRYVDGYWIGADGVMQ